MKLDELKEKDLTYFGERIEPYFASHAIIGGMMDAEGSAEVIGLRNVVRWLQYNYYFYQFTEDLLRVEEEVKTKFADVGNAYIDDLIEKCLAAGTKLIARSRDLADLEIPLDSESLAERVLEYSRALSDYTVFYQITFFERPLMALAEELAERNAGQGRKAEDLFNIISAPDRLTESEQEYDDLLRLALEKKGAESIKKHVKKYYWLSIRYFLGEPWDESVIRHRLEGVSPSQASAILNKRLRARADREKTVESVTHAFSKEDKQLVSLIRKIVYLRTQRGDFVHQSAGAARPLLLKLAELLEVSYDGLLNLYAEEIAEALRGKFDHNLHIRNRRQAFLIYHFDKVKSQVLEGSEVEAFCNTHTFLRGGAENVKSFVGKTGYRGKCSGPVKIVRTSEDVKKVNRGDIMVSAMTTSNFMPAMEKAAAFITDEGGITCHAAIIAREMHKPCVIGTKVGTKVLKDGDIVEVDADKGIIKIIK